MTRSLSVSLAFAFFLTCLSLQAQATVCTPSNYMTACDDGATCSVKSCVDGLCQYDYTARVETLCNDELPCTVDSCDPVNGAPGTGCMHVAHSELCPTVAIDNCAPYVCSLTAGCVATPDDSRCPSDGVDCTHETCNADGSCASNPDDALCPDDGIPCTADTCDPLMGCQHVANDSLCPDDGFSCTSERCDASQGCVSDPVDSFCNDNKSCTIDSCSPTLGEAGTGCLFTPNHAACNDGQICNGTETCAPDQFAADPVTGCLAGAPPCDDGIPCTNNYCNPATGACTFTPDDSFCSDSKYCTGVEHCVPGGNGADARGCVAGTPPPCADSSSCTVDTCDLESDTCKHTANLALCDDNNPCTNDTCGATGCGHSFVANEPPTSCTLSGLSGYCVDGSCIVVCTADTDCDDNDVCTGVETCSPGALEADPRGCVHGEQLFCDDNNPCTADDCSPTSGCTNIAVPDSPPSDCIVPGTETSGVCVKGVCSVLCVADDDCNDGDPCNGVETCSPSSSDADSRGCVKGQQLSCEDGVGCTVDTCQPYVGCTHTATDSLCNDNLSCTADTCNPTSGCVFTPVNSRCDNGLYCDGPETCAPTAPGHNTSTGCLAGSVPDCNDGMDCTIDSCSNEQGKCLHVATNSICDNGIYCDGSETCAPDNPNRNAKGCIAGPPVTCANDVPCAAHVCTEAAHGCVYQPNDLFCYDGPYCSGGGTCQPGNTNANALGCVMTPAPDCNDGFDCTIDSCNEGAKRCDHVASNGLCSDGNFCNGDESCEPTGANHNSRGCVAGTPPSCDDSIPCTEDLCDPIANQCVHSSTSAVAKARCSDNDPCNGVESCSPTADGHDTNGCIKGTPYTCNDGFSCTTDLCVNQGGVAACQYVPHDSACDDGKYCTGIETCNPQASGASLVTGCLDGTRPTCADAYECTIDTCDNATAGCLFAPDNSKCPAAGECQHLIGCLASSGCVYANETDGKSCGVGGKCQDGLCKQECVVNEDCNDQIDCTLDACSGGKCVHIADSSRCTGGSFCLGEKTCSATLGCVSGPAKDCNDNNPCTIDSCDDTNRVCNHLPQDSLCNDGKWCNGTEYCDQALGCVAGAAPCNDLIPCTIDSCNEETHACTYTANDAYCDDGKFCNGAETCAPTNPTRNANGCINGTSPTCMDMIFCTSDACDPALNRCAYTPQDSACDDQNPCTQDVCSPTKDCLSSPVPDVPAQPCVYDTEHPELPGVCVSGLCKPGCTKDEDCDDGFGCTTDSCDLTTHGCLHLSNDAVCSNGNLCDGLEVCDPERPLHDSLGCVLGEAPACDDGFSCTTDSCDPSTGCVFTPVHANCDDQNACNGLELCLPALLGHDERGCLAGTPLVCDDSRSCTTDSCDPSLGCTNTPVDQACDDQIPCTADACDPLLGDTTTGCTHTANNGLCADGVDCTNDVCDLALGCVNTPVDALCKDAIACTSETCDAVKGCVITPHDDLCDDGLFCNGRERCDTTTGCAHYDAPSCDDQIDCTVDSCDESRKLCLHTPSDALCGGGSFCGGAVHCYLAGGCIFSPQPNCDDQVACTQDSCDTQADACQHTANDSACDDRNPCTGPDQCIPGGCSNPKLADDTACTIENGKSGVCKNGVCSLPCTKDADCDDGAPCTDDSCGADGHCVYTAVDARCNVDRDICLGRATCVAHLGCVDGPLPDCSDAVACTIDSCAANQGCVHEPENSNCDDNNPCTTDACDAQLGCTHIALPDRTPCTSDYVCLQGECVPPDTDGDLDTTESDAESDSPEAEEETLEGDTPDGDTTETDLTEADTADGDTPDSDTTDADRDDAEPDQSESDTTEAEREPDGDAESADNDSEPDQLAENDATDDERDSDAEKDSEIDSDIDLPVVKQSKSNCQSAASSSSGFLFLLLAGAAFALRRRRSRR